MEALDLCEGFRDEAEQYEMALDLAKKDGQSTKNIEKPVPSVLFNNRNIFDYILLHIKVSI